MKNQARLNKKLILSLATILLLLIIIVALGMSRVSIVNATESAQPTEYNSYETRYYITVNDTVTAVDNKEYFLYNADSDTVIEVVFELFDCDLAPTNPADFLSMTATVQEIEVAMAIYTKQMRQFCTARNLAFLQENNWQDKAL